MYLRYTNRTQALTWDNQLKIIDDILVHYQRPGNAVSQFMTFEVGPFWLAELGISWW